VEHEVKASRLHLVAPRVPELREAVHKQHQRLLVAIGLAARHDVQPAHAGPLVVRVPVLPETTRDG